jgi:AcrR family transcriptional regulator
MGRWAPGAQSRLIQAAMKLYSEHGYEQTTVAQIAEAAGVTERTFFRYFTDKREVLFGGSQALRDDMLAALESAPPGASPIEIVRASIERLCENFTEHAFSRRRQEIINANPLLQERELIKLTSYASDLVEALRERGVEKTTARFAAEMGIAAFRVAWERWLEENGKRPMRDVFRESFDQLRVVASDRRARRRHLQR